MNSTNTRLNQVIRDMILFCALIILVREAFNRTKNFVSEHKQSIIHELDRNFIDHLYATQRHVHFLEQNDTQAYLFTNELASIKNRLADIEEKYKKNSPALALLGPIGTTAVIAKESQLQEKLLTTVNDLGLLFHTMHNYTSSFTPSTTLASAVETNKILVKSTAILA